MTQLVDGVFVLVGGWPGSGKSTLAGALGPELGLPVLAKDDLLVAALPGPVVEVRCVVPVEIARERYRARAAHRHPGHLDLARDEDELWGSPVHALGAGPLVPVDTTRSVDVPVIAARVRHVVDSRNSP